MFDLNTVEDRDAVLPIDFDVSLITVLSDTIKENLPLAIAIGTEKARSEMLIAPILIEIRKIKQRKISLFSGTELTVDRELGLVEICDYIISLSPEQYTVEAPVLMLVEAKRADLNLGMGQVVAEMVAAKKFNCQQKKEIHSIYGCITNGTQWRFLRLDDRTLYIDNIDRNLMPLSNIIGSLLSCLSS